MLRIRPDQMDALARANLRRFVVSNLPHLRRVAPEKTQALDDEALTAIALDAAHEADRFGIELAGHLRRYLEADLLLGPGFSKRPEHTALVAVLQDPGLGADTKLDRVDDYLAFGG